MKELLVLRHAKSSWKHPELDDHDRPLNQRGLTDAPRMGQVILSEGMTPERIIASTAERAQATAHLVGKACGCAAEPLLTSRLYLAGPDEYLDLLSELAAQTYMSVEYGMQTMHDRSLDWMNRGHHHDAMIDAVERSRGRGFEISAHAILGLPGESDEDMLATAREIARLDVDAVKIHNLYAVKNTQLGDDVLAGRAEMMSREHFVRVLVDFLELLSPRCVVERVSGEAPPDFFIGPSWCQDKSALLSAIDQEFQRRDSYQGFNYKPAAAC
jgi:broad specificity phosphatase PhoE